MKPLQYMFLFFLAVTADLFLGHPFFWWNWHSCFGLAILFYALLRESFIYSFCYMVFFSLLYSAFSIWGQGLLFLVIFLGGVFYLLRSHLFIESYLLQTLWCAIFLILFFWGTTLFCVLDASMGQNLWYSITLVCGNAFLILPLYMLLDHWLEGTTLQ